MSDDEYKEFSDMMSKTNYGKRKSNITDEVRNMKIDDITDSILIEFQDKMGIEPEGSEINNEQLEKVIDTFNYIRNSVNPMTLYRILISETEEQINLDSVGIHFTISEDNLDEFRFLEDIGINDNEEEFPIWKLTCKVNKDDIDVYNTIATNFRFPLEGEVMLKPNSKVDVIGVEEFY